MRRALLCAAFLGACSFHPNGATPADDQPPPAGSDAAPSGSDAPPAGSDAGLDGPPSPEACTTSTQYSDVHGGHRYRVTNAGLDYDTAVDACTADGAHLVVIDDQPEQDFVAGLLDNTGGDAWIGLNDLFVEGTEEWVTGSKHSFRAFAGGEPNDANGAEDCVYMTDDNNGHNHLWNDTSCGETRRAVCECDPAFTPPPTPSCRTATTGFVTALGRRYFVQDFATHDVASQGCAAMGAYLIGIADATENALVFKSAGTGGIGTVNDAWIGLAPDAGVKNFVWDNGSPSTFRNFQGSAPSPDATKSIEIRASNSQWTDTSSGDSERSVCECDPEHPPP